MSIAKKGSRKITVADVDYRWRVSRPRRTSDWRSDRTVLNETYLKLAAKYGLGEVADVIFNIPIELYTEPKSKILIKYFGLIIDGFLGVEQFSQVKPGLISQIISDSRQQGWNPTKKGDYPIEIFENTGEPHRPAIIVLPGINEASMTEYANLVKVVKLI